MSRIKVSYKKHKLNFKFDAGTSRGVLKSKTTYFIQIRKDDKILGLGEAAPLYGLSIDKPENFEEKLQVSCEKLEDLLADNAQDINISAIIPQDFPAIRFGLEMALLDYHQGLNRIYYKSGFITGANAIPINGLIWMSDKTSMLGQIKSKLESGYKCIKIKIGAINFEEECELLAFIRKQFGPDDITIRVDANGAFKPEHALEKLKILSDFNLHSIEQPIAANNHKWMKVLCEQSPLAIALDEELIGVFDGKKQLLLEEINPQYIILKPSLLGGFKATDEWISYAKSMNIGWWITSALESNIGLNAIAQYTAQLPYESFQGLGTGQLFHNNIPSPLTIEEGELYYSPNLNWDLSLFN